LSFLADRGRIQFVSITDKEAMAGFDFLTRMEGILPALESSHAVGFLKKSAGKLKKSSIIIVNLSGRGDKDMGTIAKFEGIRLE
jgi:tryptophan synthase beta chain